MSQIYDRLVKGSTWQEKIAGAATVGIWLALAIGLVVLQALGKLPS